MVVLQADENPFLQKGTKSEFDGRHNLSVIVQTEDGCIESPFGPLHQEKIFIGLKDNHYFWLQLQCLPPRPNPSPPMSNKRPKIPSASPGLGLESEKQSKPVTTLLLD